jgi:ubiquinone/menaquinone biosynthesis C-methylase UbiE
MKNKYTNNFDKIAPVYDGLSKLVFGKAQIKAQIDQLKFLPGQSRILIVGGGTGFILEAISKIFNEGLEIVYVELSQKMITKAKQRNTKNNTLQFLQIDIADYESDILFDVILTPYLFDNFLYDKAEQAFNKLNHLLKNEGLWFSCDFCITKGSGKFWKIILTNMMYLFFKTFGMVQGSKLVPIQNFFTANNYTLIDDAFYYSGFIEARIFKK